jgi:DUF2927 family protein
MPTLLRPKNLPTWPALMTVGLFGLSACVETPPNSGVSTSPTVTTRSAESVRLEKYYSSLQARLQTQGLLRTDGGGPDAPFSSRTLAEDFERIALYDEYTVINGRFVARATPSSLRRWQKPVRIGLIFGDLVPEEDRVKDRANVTAYAKRLARLTGLDIRVTDSNPNFRVMFLYRDEQKAAAPMLQRQIPDLSPIVVREIVNSPRNTFCVAYSFSDPDNTNIYDSALILVKAEHSGIMRQSCIHEEMAQALGLVNDSPNARPSIFNDDEEFALLTRHDELLLRMLYDRRLKVGMTPLEARPLLPRIASDVLGGS